MSSYQELLLYTKQLERRLSKLEWQEQVLTVAGGDHGTLSGLGDDDHTQYLLASAAGGRTSFGANWTDLTDTGATTLHKHDHGGQDGLTDDDHTQYLLASAATNRATFAANWTDLTDTGATTLHKHDHGGQDGLTDDDHTQYLLASGLRSAAQSGPQLFNNAVFAAGGIIGSNNANGDLTINGTSDAAKTTSYVLIQPSGGKVGIGTSVPDFALHVADTIVSSGANAAFQAYDRANGAAHAFGLYTSSNIGRIYSWGKPGDIIGFDEAGNVGIGTVLPSTLLDIKAGILNIQNSGYDNSFTEVLRVGLNNYTGTANWRNSIYSSVSSTAASSGLKFAVANAQTTQVDVMTLRGNGNVGVGTTAPSTTLHISSPTPTMTYTCTRVSGGFAFDTMKIAMSNAAGSSELINVGILGTADPNTLSYLYIGTDYSNNALRVYPGKEVYVDYRIGIGTASPEEKLHISAGHALLSNAYYYAAENASGTNIRLAGIDSSNNVYLGAIDNAGAKVFIREDGADVITLHGANVGIGTTAPNGKLQVEGRVGIKTGVNAVGAQLFVYQDSTTAAIPVLRLTQDDVSEEFIYFNCAVAAGNAIDTAALGTYYGKIRVSVNGTFKYMALYNS